MMMKFSKIEIDDEGEAVYKGVVDLGIMGKYDKIIIDLDGYEGTGATEEMPEEERIKKMSIYYERRFKELELDVENINEQFLMWLIDHLCSIEYPFWKNSRNYKGTNKYPDYIREDEIKKYENEQGQVIHDLYSSSLIYKNINKYDLYNNPQGLTSYEIIDKYMPVLDLKKLAATIKADSIDTFEDQINFQLSSEVCDGLLMCATYGYIDEDNKLTVTNNC